MITSLALWGEMIEITGKRSAACPKPAPRWIDRYGIDGYGLDGYGIDGYGPLWPAGRSQGHRPWGTGHGARAAGAQAMGHTGRPAGRAAAASASGALERAASHATADTRASDTTQATTTHTLASGRRTRVWRSTRRRLGARSRSARRSSYLPH